MLESQAKRYSGAASVTLFRRLIRIGVAGLVITDPRISVMVERQADSTQTTGHVSIYNLAPAREQQIYQRSTDITIQAGYPGTIASIFSGQVQRVRRPRQDLAKITYIELGDGVHREDTLGGVTARSYAGPVSLRQIAGDFVSDMELQLGPLDAIPITATITDFVWFGPASEGLTVACRKFDVRWFEDDEFVRFRRAAMTQPDAPSLQVSPSRGLIGAPLATDEGAECVMFLNPQAKIGGLLTLSSETLSGRYRIVGLRHEADNWENPFRTWCDLREVL